MNRPIVSHPDPRLSTRSAEVEHFDAGLRGLVLDLADTMVAERGVGIAAVQIGVLARVFLVEPYHAGVVDRPVPPLCFVNPEVQFLDEGTESADEGCLSVGRFAVPVERWLALRIRARDLDGRAFVLDVRGFLARVIQHEFDHLEGRTVYDHATDERKQFIDGEMRAP